MSDQSDRSEYLANLFLPEADEPLPNLPLPDESHVESWRQWRPDGEISLADLAQQLPQLHFGVEPGIAKTPAYHKAILGADASAVPDQPLQRNGRLAYSVVQHWAGSLPTISTKNREDFEWLFRILGFKGEEIDISPNVHALFITGLPNPGRLRSTKASWDRGELEDDPLVSGCTDWNTAIKAIDQGDKTRFRDRIILIHHEPYANLDPKTVSESMHAEEWLSISATLRLEHEFAHYATRRLFNNMRLNLHDELIADCMGFTKALGTFRADLFLMGLGITPGVLPDARARAWTYLGTLAKQDVLDVCELIASAAHNVEEALEAGAPHERVRLLKTLAAHGVQGLAMDSACESIRIGLAQKNT